MRKQTKQDLLGLGLGYFGIFLLTLLFIIVPEQLETIVFWADNALICAIGLLVLYGIYIYI